MGRKSKTLMFGYNVCIWSPFPACCNVEDPAVTQWLSIEHASVVPLFWGGLLFNIQKNWDTQWVFPDSYFPMKIIAIACTVLLGIAGRLCVIWARQEPHCHEQGPATKQGKSFPAFCPFFFFFNRKLTGKMVSLWSNGEHIIFVAFSFKDLMTTAKWAQFLWLSDALLYQFLMCCFKTIPAPSTSPKKQILTLHDGKTGETKFLSFPSDALEQLQTGGGVVVGEGLLPPKKRGLPMTEWAMYSYSHTITEIFSDY